MSDTDYSPANWLTRLRWRFHGEKHPWKSGHTPHLDFQRCGLCFRLIFPLAHGGKTYEQYYGR